MQSNPYLRQHFGQFVVGRDVAEQEDEDSDSMDASEGFARFKNPAHMKFSVFKPSKCTSKPANAAPLTSVQPVEAIAAAERITPPGFQIAPGHRGGIRIDNFPSKPPTPRSVSSLNASALPPLMPTHASPTPRSVQPQCEKYENASSTSTTTSCVTDQGTSCDLAVSSPARSPHSPYAPKPPMPATRNVFGSPTSQSPPAEPEQATAASTCTAARPDPSATNRTPVGSHDDTIAKLIQRSTQALRRAQDAMNGGPVGDSGELQQSLVDVSPQTPSLSPPPPLSYVNLADMAHRRPDASARSSETLEKEDEMETFASDNVPFLSPSSEFADETRCFPQVRDATMAPLRLSGMTPGPEPAIRSESASQCLHAALLTDTDVLVRRRLSRRPRAAQTSGTRANLTSHSLAAPAPTASAQPAERRRYPSHPRSRSAASRDLLSSCSTRGNLPEGVSSTPPPRPPSDQVMTLDSLSSMIEQLGRFLHQGQTPPPFGPKDGGTLVRPLQPSFSSQQSVAGAAKRPGRVHTAPAPTVLMGTHYPKPAPANPAVPPHEMKRHESVSHRATSIPSDDDDGRLPSYAQPTESWKLKLGPSTDDSSNRATAPFSSGAEAPAAW